MHVSYGLDDGLLFAVYSASAMYTVPRFPADFTGTAEDPRAAQLPNHFPHRNRPLHGYLSVRLAGVPLLVL